MLTWAMVHLAKHGVKVRGLLFATAMVFDLCIVFVVAQVFIK
jgi:hypothetical protein